MFELTEGRRNSLKAFLTNAGTVSLAGLIIGTFAREGEFRLSLFVAGCTVYFVMLVCCWLLDGPKKEG